MYEITDATGRMPEPGMKVTYATKHITVPFKVGVIESITGAGVKIRREGNEHVPDYRRSGCFVILEG